MYFAGIDPGQGGSIAIIDNTLQEACFAGSIFDCDPSKMAKSCLWFRRRWYQREKFVDGKAIIPGSGSFTEKRPWQKWCAVACPSCSKLAPELTIKLIEGEQIGEQMNDTDNTFVGETCGAKTRKGTPCKRKDVYWNGRCKLHGGLSTGPRTAEGKRRSSQNARKKRTLWER